MAREWRRAVFAALAAAMLGGACLLSVQARAANEEAEEEQEQTPASDAQPKGGKKRQDPAEAQRAIEAALKQVQAGRTEQGVQAMTATLSGGNLPPAIMAKALYVRGLAHRQQGRSAQAISDLNGALWLKGGLGSEDRIEATKERSAAYADAGLRGRGGEAEEPAPKAASGGFLSGLFGSPTPAAEPPAPARQPPLQPQAAKVEPTAPARPPPVSSGWSSKTEVQTARSALAVAPPPRSAAVPPKAVPPKAAPPKAAPAAARAEPPAAAGKIKGRYLVQLAAVRTEAEAQAVVAKAKRVAALASRQAAIDRAVLGNMGSFYRVRFGPFASAQETKAVCGKLQGSGFDCLPVAR